ncbi:MAG: peptidoglycan DD-metalloendopeptidase family protein [Oscillospiraceae bacterium]|nr:peptidoglycan DD-metalloendopeptidase family protein [Oscillospiraceae bacterium]
MHSVFDVFLNSLGIIFRTIRAFFTRRLMGVIARIRRLGSASRYAAKALPKAVGAVTLAAKKPSKREDYFETKRLYIAKSLIAAIVIIVILLGVFTWYVAYPFAVSRFFTLKIWQDDARLAEYTGRVVVYYDSELERPWARTRLDGGEVIQDAKVYGEDGGLVYEGGFGGFVYSGAGALYSDGALLYEGGFADGLRSGAGKEYYPDKSLKFDGGFESGVYSGTGREYYPNGSLRYDGGFEAGVYSGSGRQLRENGSMLYNGEFSDGLYNGAGKYYTAAESYIDGEFRDGALQGDGTLYVSGKLAYKGAFGGEAPMGYGTMYDMDSGDQLFAGVFSGDGIDLAQFGGLDVRTARRMFFDSPLYERVSDGRFTIEAQESGITLMCSLRTDESEPAVVGVMKSEGRARSLAAGQTGSMYFEEGDAPDSGQNAGGVGTGEPGGSGEAGGAEDAAAIADALESLPDKEEPITAGGEADETLEDPAKILRANTLDMQSLGETVAAVASYAENKAKFDVYSKQAALRRRDREKAAEAAMTGEAGQKLLDEIDADIGRLQGQMNVCTLEAERAFLAVKALTGEDVTRYDAAAILIDVNPADFDLAAMSARLDEDSTDADFKMKTLDLSVARQNLSLLRSAYNKALDALEDTKTRYLTGAADEYELDSSVIAALGAYEAVYSGLCGYTRMTAELNLMCGGWISERYGWFNDEFEAALAVTALARAEEAAKAQAEAEAEGGAPDVLPPEVDVSPVLMDAGYDMRFKLLIQTGGRSANLWGPLGFEWKHLITSGFGWRIHPISGNNVFHNGVDIGVPTGTAVLAAHGGVVRSASYDEGGYGRSVVIAGDGFVTRYAHCDELFVSAGQTVAAGDVIAKSGNTGYSTGPHLHFEVMRDGQYIDPAYFA